LVQTVTDYAIFMLDPTGRIASWNEGAQRIKGYASTEIIGTHFSRFYPPEDLAWDKPAYELTAAVRDGRFEDEGWRLRKDGTRFWANVIITPLRDDTGTLVGFAKITRDLTERRSATERAIEDARRIAIEETARTAAEHRAQELTRLTVELDQRKREVESANQELQYRIHEEQALAEELEEINLQLQRAIHDADTARRAAEHANQAKVDFLAAMSHELRTPLNAIGGYAELMEMGLRGPITDAQRSDLGRIRHSQQHLLGIINDILNFSRIEAGYLTYDIARVDLGEALANVNAMIGLQAAAKGITFAAAAPPAGTAVRADRPKLEQVILNLLSNAVKFTASGGRIELGYAIHDDRIEIHVHDTGRGIEADKQASIFEPFVQVNRSLTHVSEGTGLGLAISRDLARGMGGDVTVESTLNVGSTFTVRLPRDD